MNEAADRSRKAGMEENVKAVFISNYINHHQIPFSNALYEQLGDDYHFIQTEPMEEERIAMGWGLDAATLPYVVWADREEERCRKLIEEADLVFAARLSPPFSFVFPYNIFPKSKIVVLFSIKDVRGEVNAMGEKETAGSAFCGRNGSLLI